MNWMSKIDAMLPMVKEAAIAHWEIAFVLPMILAVAATLIAMKSPEKSAAMRSRMRVLRYCHSCPYIDLLTETCSVDAADHEKCGLVDKTSGMTFTVTKN